MKNIKNNSMEELKELFDGLAAELGKDLGDWQSVPETEEDLKLKEKIIRAASDIND